jgi:hypothetical protein
MENIVPLMSLWLPIILSAVFVFITSSIIHMFLGYHANDFKVMPGEDQVMEALRKLNVPPGDYAMPRAGSMKAMSDPVYLEKYKKGPVGFITIFKSEKPSMGKELGLWFLYSIIVSICAAYIAGRALGPDAPYLSVHRFVGAAAFLGYSLALMQNSIWFKRSWKTTLKSMFDGLIYASVTGGTFGWLWPHM